MVHIMETSELKYRIEQFQEDMKKRVLEEYSNLREEGFPSEDDQEIFLKNLRWESPELAIFVKKEFEKIKKC